jgi:hypothetical protein
MALMTGLRASRTAARAAVSSPVIQASARPPSQRTRAGPRGESLLSRVPIHAPFDGGSPVMTRHGLPGALKSGIESLSGVSLEDVRVHYRSPQPARVNAEAYAHRGEIHLAPGMEHHLPHEAWHLVQQARGRVRPTKRVTDTLWQNDDASLEREAKAMGARALTHSSGCGWSLRRGGWSSTVTRHSDKRPPAPVRSRRSPTRARPVQQVRRRLRHRRAQCLPALPSDGRDRSECGRDALPELLPGIREQ